MSKKPKILYFDIETSPNIVFVWSLGKQYVAMDQIHKERKVTCICYKWQGESKIHSLKMDMNKHDLTQHDDDADREMLAAFSDIYKQADLTVAHNGVKYDVAFIRSRLAKYKLPDIAPIVMDDTYLASKSIRFNSHKLDYISQYLGIGKKAPHPYKLWVDVMRGSTKALDDTVKYCQQDVRLLEKVYDALLPYIKTKFNRALHAGNGLHCPSCGSKRVQQRGFSVLTNGSKKIRAQCQDCGKWSCTGAVVPAKDRYALR